MTIRKPLFIVFEGIDGCGKTTQIELLKNNFSQQELHAADTHEPTNGPIGMIIQDVMKGKFKTDQSTIAGLFAADRLDHVNNPEYGMKKQLEEGKNVICSRYYFSSYAFQGEYVPIDWLIEINSLSKSQLKPDIVFYINLDPSICLERINSRREEIEMYENLTKLTKTHEAYLDSFEKYGSDENIHIIDGSRTIEEISKEIWNITEQQLQLQNEYPITNNE